jgi:hypothetical protein
MSKKTARYGAVNKEQVFSCSVNPRKVALSRVIFDSHKGSGRNSSGFSGQLCAVADNSVHLPIPDYISILRYRRLDWFS